MDDTIRQHGECSTGGKAVRLVGPVLLTLRDLRREKNVDSFGRQQMAGTETDQSSTVASAQRASDPPRAASALASSTLPVESAHTSEDEDRRKSSLRTVPSDSDKRMTEHPHRQPPARQSMWSRIAASLFLLVLLGIAYLTFRGPVVHDSGDGFRAPLLNVTEVDEQDRWYGDAAPIDVARRNGGTIGHRVKPVEDHQVPTELMAEDSSVISSSPAARQESQTDDVDSAANLDEVTRLDGVGETFSSLPRWNEPTNHPVPRGQKPQGMATEGSVWADEPTSSLPLDQRDVTLAPTGSDGQVVLGGVLYPSTGYVAHIQPRSIYPNTRNSTAFPAPRIAADPAAMCKRQFDGNASGFGQGRPSRPRAGYPRLHGTIDNPYIERSYESGRSSLY